MFIANAGQFDPRARFLIRGGPATLWLAEDSVWATVVETSPPSSPLDGEQYSPLHLLDQPERLRVRHDGQAVHLRLSFPGANPNPRLEPFNRLPMVVSYFIGKDPSMWHPAVPVWGGVRYRDLYPGVDLEITAGDSRWTWRWVVRSLAPAGLQQLDRRTREAPRLRIEGGDGVELLPGGQNLLIRTAAGQYTLPLPEGEHDRPHAVVRRVATCTFDIDNPSATPSGTGVGTAPSAPRTLQAPSLDYAGFLGGSGEDNGNAIDIDAAGRAYVTGSTRSPNFPAVVGPDLTFNGSPWHYDAFVAKVKPDGRGLVYASFLGGSDDDRGGGIAADGAGNAYVTGWTHSPDFPAVVRPGPPRGSLINAFVAKVNPRGTGLIYSGFLGGSGGDVGKAIAVDPEGNAYVTGMTSSTDFPVVGGPSLTLQGSGDAFVAKLNPDGRDLSYAGFLGGSDVEWALDIALDESGSAYVTGTTWSADFPVVGGPDLSFNGAYDAYVAKVSPDGTGLVYAGFLGGSDTDEGRGIAVDGLGNAYVSGSTASPDFPVLVGPKLTHDRNDAFVAKVKADGTELAYAGFLSGSDYDVGWGIAVDGAGNAYVTGETRSPDFPVVAGPSLTLQGYSDAFVAKVSPGGSALLYAGFLGGSGGDVGSDIAVDAAGNAYVTGETSSADFPALRGPLLTYSGSGDSFVARIGRQQFQAFLPVVPHGHLGSYAPGPRADHPAR